MTIDLCKTSRHSDEFEFIPICSADQFSDVWSPAITEMGLLMLECLPVLEVTEEFKHQFQSELHQLKAWAVEHSDRDRVRSMLESIDLILQVVDATNLNEYEISFG